MTDLLLVFGAGLGAGFLNVMAGGGSLITLPTLLFLGMPAALANGTNRAAILVQNISAVASFRAQGVRGLSGAVLFALLTVPGAIAGAIAAVHVSDATFRAVLAGVLVVAGIGIFAPRRAVRTDGTPPSRRAVAASAAGFLGIGFYGGFIQAGVGFLIMAVLHGILAFDLVRVNAWKVFIVLVFTLPALTVFVLSGNVAWSTAGALAVGMAGGAHLAARVAVRRGEGPIRVVVAIAFLLMAFRLIRGG